TLKGVAGNLGATAVQDAAQALDVRLRAALEGRESQAVQTSAAAQEPAPVPDPGLAEALAHLRARQDALVAGLRDWLASAGQPQPAPDPAETDGAGAAALQTLRQLLETGDATAPAWATEHATALAAALGPRHAALRQAL
ncbi:hypothetical protein HA630_00865, partial [Aquabacterium sp. A08]|nr:hypothetical protein [Aquabacterium sp. A08]